jgi:hypothetical protein
MPTAPVCCCPAQYQSSARTGSFLCPKGPTGDGPFAYHPKSLLDSLAMDAALTPYPFCHSDLTTKDRQAKYSKLAQNYVSTR